VDVQPTGAGALGSGGSAVGAPPFVGAGAAAAPPAALGDPPTPGGDSRAAADPAADPGSELSPKWAGEPVDSETVPLHAAKNPRRTSQQALPFGVFSETGAGMLHMNRGGARMGQPFVPARRRARVALARNV